MVIQFQYKVLLIGLDKNDESLTVQGKDDNRLNSTGCLLLLQELMEKPGYHQLDTEGIGNKFKQLIREVEEPIYTRAMIEPLNIGLKQKLWALITDADYPCINKEKIRSKNLEKKTIIVKKKSITDIESAKRRREPSFTEMQPSSSRQRYFLIDMYTNTFADFIVRLVVLERRSWRKQEKKFYSIFKPV